MVKFSFHNAKINALAKHLGLRKNQVVSFDLPAGYSCPKANICKTFCNPVTGKMIRVGAVMCYAAKVECYAPSCRRMRWMNYTALKDNDKYGMMFELSNALPATTRIVRIHSSGDFFSKDYFTAWLDFTACRPEITFYGYTKILEYAIAEKPENFHLVYSYGSLDDGMHNSNVPTCYIQEYENQYPYPVVCGSHDASHEDYFAILNKQTFVLNIH